MKLRRLWIGQYRVLQDFTIDFSTVAESGLGRRSPAYQLDFLVGVNGTGKSTVLRALGEIFQRLSGDSTKANFPFKIEYTLGNDSDAIAISNADLDTGVMLGRYQIERSQDATPSCEPEFVDEVSKSDLPDAIVAYTTGSESEWQNLDRSDIFRIGNPEQVKALSQEKQVIQELPGKPKSLQQGNVQQNERFLFIKKDDLSLITLCGLLTNLSLSTPERPGPLAPVLEQVRVQAFHGFSLRFRMNQTSDEREQIWQRLGQFATRRINVGADYLFVFDYSQATNATDVLRESGGGLSFFRFLAQLFDDSVQQILTEVNIFIERSKPDRDAVEADEAPLHLFEWLSDGEQNFVGRMCLFTLFGNTNVLILLDEPEVHFNDYWKRQIVHFIDQVFQRSTNDQTSHTSEQHSSHLLISTHSSIALTDAYATDIIRMERESAITTRAAIPRFQTFGADPSDIMVHIFDAPQPSGEYSVQRIKKRLSDARIGRIEKSELESDLQYIAPGYWSYRVRRQLLRMQ